MIVHDDPGDDRRYLAPPVTVTRAVFPWSTWEPNWTAPPPFFEDEPQSISRYEPAPTIASPQMLWTMLKRYHGALTTILRDHGKVCEEFETCRHESCRSSVASYFVAERAMRETMAERCLLGLVDHSDPHPLCPLCIDEHEESGDGR